MVQHAETSLSLETLRQIVREVCEPRGVARVELFGSQATGQATADSDIDLLVEFLPDVHAGLLEMGELRELLTEKLGREVDLVSRRAIEQSSNRYAKRSILHQRIVLYAR